MATSVEGENVRSNDPQRVLRKVVPGVRASRPHEGVDENAEGHAPEDGETSVEPEVVRAVMYDRTDVTQNGGECNVEGGEG